jgi:hypothetical protein
MAVFERWQETTVVRQVTGMMILTATAWLLAGLATARGGPEVATAPAIQPGPDAESDPALAAATAMVEKSDRYLHHSRLKPGMKGYGLTVLSGTQPMRFDVEILSVMTRWAAHQDVILVRLGGAEMERLGVSSGMSGSPVYVRDERDGKDKLIGAVAFAFRATKEPICGLQPITQMLAIRQRPTTTQPAEAGAPAEASGKRVGRELLAAVLDPRQTEFIPLLWRAYGRRLQPSSPTGRELMPLATPLTISGLSQSTLRRVEQPLREAGLLPVQAGGVAAAPATDAAFVPGSAISISLITGDIDLSGVGTVTDVDGDHLLALGHGLFAEGDVEFPIGPAHVHTVVPNLLTSFKLSSATGITGTLVRDENVGVSVVVGRAATMIPVTVSLERPGQGPPQHFRYGIARHRFLTPLLAEVVLTESAFGWRELPEQHTVRHSVDIDFGALGHYRAVNVESGNGTARALTDLLRPLVALLNNPLGPPATVRAIDVQITVTATDQSAEILDLKLDGRVYRPGEQVMGQVTIKPFRKARQTIPIGVSLPSDLPDGTYTLTACDALYATEHMITEMPQRFDPKTVEELFGALHRVGETQGDCLYLRLPLVGRHLAVGHEELADLPESRKGILSQAVPPGDAQTFTQSLVTSVSAPYVLSGQATAELEVEREPKQIPTR